MAELPTARVHLRDAKDQLAVAAAHARRGARHVLGLARCMWTFLLASVAAAYVFSRMGAWTEPARVSYEPPRLIYIQGDLQGDLQGVDRLEIVDVPSPTGRGTIKSLARKRTPPAPAAP